MWKNKIPGVLGIIILLVMPLSGYSQSIESKDKFKVELETITVTAQKREEFSQKIPVSLVIFDETTQEDRMIEDVEALVPFIPNMSSFDTTVLGENVITMRGITASATTRSTATGMYIDGIPVLTSFGFNADLFDIERVEVLRGPQGTLYGKSTQAGAVNIVTVKPQNIFTGKLTGEGGLLLPGDESDSFTGSISGIISGPLVDKTLAFSLAGKASHKDGFVDNLITGKKEYAHDSFYGGGKLYWAPTDELNITCILSAKELRQDGNNANRAGGINRVVSSDLASWQDVNANMQAINVQYDVSDTTKLTSISTRSDMELDGNIDFDFSNMKFMHGRAVSDTEHFSQELRLNASRGNWDWLFGVYWDHQEIYYNAKIDSINSMYKASLITNLTGKSYAGYVDAGYKLSNKIKLLGGLRYEWQQYDFESSILSDSHDENWTHLSPKVGLQYECLSNVTLYATISEGYRPGGFNDRAFNPQYSKYDPESLWSYEVGLKNVLLNNRLIINGAVFHMDISDMQVEENISLTEYYLTNAASATSLGAEVDFTLILTEGLTVYGGFGIVHAKFESFHDVLGNYTDNKLPYAPEYNYNIGMQYRSVAGFYVGGNVTGYGKTYFDKINSACRNDYALVNVKIGYETENFDIYLYGKNIFDQEYDVSNWMGMDVYSEPGQVGLQLTMHF